MKLSEAILKGVDNHPGVVGQLFWKDPEEGEIAACALGAAYLGRNGLDGIKDSTLSCASKQTGYWNKLMYQFPILELDLRDIPRDLIPEEFLVHLINLRHDKIGILRDAIYLIYDHSHELEDVEPVSRKAIAMWISTIEDYLDNGKMTEDEKRISVEENRNCLQEYVN